MGNNNANQTPFATGTISVTSGVILTGQTVSSGTTVSTVDVLSSGTADGAKVYSGGNVFVSAGGLVSGTQIFNDGIVTVSRGGTASGSVLSGVFNEEIAKQIVYGTAVGTVVDAGGGLYALSGGGIHGTLVASGAAAYVEGGKSYGTKVNAGGLEYDAGLSIGNKINGVLEIEQSSIASNTKIDRTGSAYVGSGSYARNTSISGGLLNLESGGAAKGYVKFAGGGGIFEIDPGGKLPTGVISGFAKGDEIILGGIAYHPSDKVIVGSGTVTIKSGGHSYVLNIAGATPTKKDFTFGSGSILTTTQAPPAMTFLHPVPAPASPFAPTSLHHAPPAAPNFLAHSAVTLAAVPNEVSRPTYHGETAMPLHSALG